MINCCHLKYFCYFIPVKLTSKRPTSSSSLVFFQLFRLPVVKGQLFIPNWIIRNSLNSLQDIKRVFDAPDF